MWLPFRCTLVPRGCPLLVDAAGLCGSLRVPMPSDSILEDQLVVKWKKKEKKLIVTMPTSRAAPAEAPAAPAPPPVVAAPPAAAEEVASSIIDKAAAAEPSKVAKKRELPAVHAPAGEAVASEEEWAPRLEFELQEGLEELRLASSPQPVAEAKIVDGVSDFSIFKHNLGKEFDAIYSATRANLPTIAPDEDDEDDDDLEVLDASGKLEALKKRTYAAVEAKGLRLTGGPAGVPAAGGAN